MEEDALLLHLVNSMSLKIHAHQLLIKNTKNKCEQTHIDLIVRVHQKILHATLKQTLCAHARCRAHVNAICENTDD